MYNDTYTYILCKTVGHWHFKVGHYPSLPSPSYDPESKYQKSLILVGVGFSNGRRPRLIPCDGLHYHLLQIS